MRITVLACVAALSVHASAQFEWEQLPDFPGTARDDAAAFIWQCNAYVGTGMEVGWGLTNDWWRFDLVTEIWWPAAALPSAPRQYCAAARVGSIGYLIGGLTTTEISTEVWALDLLNGTWSQGPSLPAPGRYAGSTFTLNGRVYYFGGIFAGAAASNELWELVNGTWSQRASLPGIGRHRASAFSALGLGYLVGGADATYSALDEVWSYDPLQDAWTALSPMPEPRYAAGSVTLASGCQILGGVDDTGTIRNDGWYFSPIDGTWSQFLSNLPSPRKGAIMLQSVPCTQNNNAYFGLGWDGNARQQDWHKHTLLVGLNDQDAATLSIGPNPVIDRLSIEFPSAWIAPEFIVMDAEGRRIASGSLRQTKMDVSALASGAYILILRHANEQLAARFIKLP